MFPHLHVSHHITPYSHTVLLFFRCDFFLPMLIPFIYSHQILFPHDSFIFTCGFPTWFIHVPFFTLKACVPFYAILFFIILWKAWSPLKCMSLYNKCSWSQLDATGSTDRSIGNCWFLALPQINRNFRVDVRIVLPALFSRMSSAFGVRGHWSRFFKVLQWV